jgi:hypothetical protein
MVTLHRNTKMMDLTTIIAGTLVHQVRTFGATQLTPRKDGNIVHQLLQKLGQHSALKGAPEKNAEVTEESKQRLSMV